MKRTRISMKKREKILPLYSQVVKIKN
jgi:hypothetical protein